MRVKGARLLGEYLTTQGKYAEAEPLLIESYEELRPVKDRTILGRLKLCGGCSAFIKQPKTPRAAQRYRGLLQK
jgi:hypothetical protein